MLELVGLMKIKKHYVYENTVSTDFHRKNKNGLQVLGFSQKKQNQRKQL
jgi:hypothetical protein